MNPARGDAPNKAVREEADLAVKAVFSLGLSDCSLRVCSSSFGAFLRLSD